MRNCLHDWFTRSVIFGRAAYNHIAKPCKQLARLIHTLRHLKIRQLVFLILRRAIKPAHTLAHPTGDINPKFALCAHNLQHQCVAADRLVFLNTPSPFLIRAINWHPAQMSKLWRYNLHYFDYLNESTNQAHGLDQATRNFLIQHWIDHNPYPQEDAWEPYPTSLRIINWIKYLHESKQTPIPQAWLTNLYQQGHYLSRHIEWHIDANHLLKNIIALVIWSHYFNDGLAQYWQQRSLALLGKICAEQFLEDGGHYERSPMYHFILMHHLLDVYNCLKNTTGTAPQWLEKTLTRGLIYCQIIVKPDGCIPLIKDSAEAIAPSLGAIKHYAQQLAIWPNQQPAPAAQYYLPLSGYFIVKSTRDYILFDVGNISPRHQPGHSHCDALHLEVVWNGRDLFTDSGVYNYVASEERRYARSVRAHNTLSINSQEQHDIWDVFRVARRGHTKNVQVDASACSAEFYPPLFT